MNEQKNIESMNEYGAALTRLRRKFNIEKDVDISRRTGIPQDKISRIKSGGVKRPFDDLFIIAKAYGYTLDELMAGGLSTDPKHLPDKPTSDNLSTALSPTDKNTAEISTKPIDNSKTDNIAPVDIMESSDITDLTRTGSGSELKRTREGKYWVPLYTHIPSPRERTMSPTMLMQVPESQCRDDVFGIVLTDDSMGDRDLKGDRIVFEEHPDGIHPPYEPNRPYLVKYQFETLLCKIKDMGDKVKLEFNNIREPIFANIAEIQVVGVGLEGVHGY